MRGVVVCVVKGWEVFVRRRVMGDLGSFFRLFVRIS